MVSVNYPVDGVCLDEEELSGHTLEWCLLLSFVRRGVDDCAWIMSAGEVFL